MINKIKKYLEYRRNRRLAKREAAKLGAVMLPAVREVSGKGADIVRFIVKLTNAAKDIDGERLIEMVLNEVSGALQADNSRIIEVLTYIAKLQPEDIQRILIYSISETMNEAMDVKD